MVHIPNNNCCQQLHESKVPGQVEWSQSQIQDPVIHCVLTTTLIIYIDSPVAFAFRRIDIFVCSYQNKSLDFTGGVWY